MDLEGDGFEENFKVVEGRITYRHDTRFYIEDDGTVLGIYFEGMVEPITRHSSTGVRVKDILTDIRLYQMEMG